MNRQTHYLNFVVDEFNFEDEARICSISVHISFGKEQFRCRDSLLFPFSPSLSNIFLLKVSYQFQGIGNTNNSKSIARQYVVQRVSRGNSILRIAVRAQRSVDAVQAFQLHSEVNNPIDSLRGDNFTAPNPFFSREFFHYPNKPKTSKMIG